MPHKILCAISTLLHPITLLSCADKCKIVTIMKVYIEKEPLKSLQVELIIRYRTKCSVYSRLLFAKRRIQCNIAKRPSALYVSHTVQLILKYDGECSIKCQ